MVEFRCKKCNKLLARYLQCQDLEIKCGRCGNHNHLLHSDTPVRHASTSNTSHFIPRTGSSPIPAGASLG